MKTFREILNELGNDIRWAAGNGITVDVQGKDIRVVVKKVHKKAGKLTVVDSSGMPIMIDMKQVKG